MKDSIKKGIGFAIGYSIGKGALVYVLKIICANSDCCMKYFRDNDPKMHEMLENYRFK